jgi:hypothetical protein
MALNAQILLSILAHESSSGDISQTLRATPATYSLTLGNGTGANQAQVAWSDVRTAGESPDDLDLTSLSDDRGTVSFSAIKAAYLRNTHASNQVDIRGGAAIENSWTGFAYADESGADLVVLPGGAAFVSAPTAGGIAVSPAYKILRLVANPGTTYEIILIGEGTVA